MTDRTLLNSASTPADMVGYGPIPAGVARRLIGNLDPKTRLWLRRLYTQPGTGQLVAMESSRRCFPKPLRRFLTVRDQYCRTPLVRRTHPAH